jgi:hypothetical protein
MRSLMMWMIVLSLLGAAAPASRGGTAKSARPATAKPTAAEKTSDGKTTAKTAAAAKDDGWPDTPAGAMARRWTAAFSAGEPAFRAFLEGELNQESLEKKPMSERLKIYRDNRDRWGTLKLGSIVSSSPTEVVASLLDADLAPHEFTFTVNAEPPNKMKSVTAKMYVQGHGGFGFHH